MSDDSLTIKVDDKALTKLLRQIANKTENTRPLMKPLSLAMLNSVEENFKKEGRPDGWRSLSPATMEQRKNEGTWPGKILQRSQGGLAASMETDFDNDSATVGTNKVYAKIQQFGGTITPKKGKYLCIPVKSKGGKISKMYRVKKVVIPARPYMLIPDNDKDAFANIIKKYLQKDL